MARKICYCASNYSSVSPSKVECRFRRSCHRTCDVPHIAYIEDWIVAIYLLVSCERQQIQIQLQLKCYHESFDWKKRLLLSASAEIWKACTAQQISKHLCNDVKIFVASANKAAFYNKGSVTHQLADGGYFILNLMKITTKNTSTTALVRSVKLPKNCGNVFSWWSKKQISHFFCFEKKSSVRQLKQKRFTTVSITSTQIPLRLQQTGIVHPQEIPWKLQQSILRMQKT